MGALGNDCLTRNMDARTLCRKLHAVIGALNVAFNDPTFGQWRLTMGTSIRQCRDLTTVGSVEHYLLGANGTAKRLFLYFF